MRTSDEGRRTYERIHEERPLMIVVSGLKEEDRNMIERIQDRRGTWTMNEEGMKGMGHRRRNVHIIGRLAEGMAKTGRIRKGLIGSIIP